MTCVADFGVIKYRPEIHKMLLALDSLVNPECTPCIDMVDSAFVVPLEGSPWREVDMTGIAGDMRCVEPSKVSVCVPDPSRMVPIGKEKQSCGLQTTHGQDEVASAYSKSVLL
jgi:hypothetical protein